MNLKQEYIKNCKVTRANKFRYCEGSFFSDYIKRIIGISTYYTHPGFHNFVWVRNPGHRRVSGTYSNIKKVGNNLKRYGSYSEHKWIRLTPNHTPKSFSNSWISRITIATSKVTRKRGSVQTGDQSWKRQYS